MLILSGLAPGLYSSRAASWDLVARLFPHVIHPASSCSGEACTSAYKPSSSTKTGLEVRQSLGSQILACTGCPVAEISGHLCEAD